MEFSWFHIWLRSKFKIIAEKNIFLKNIGVKSKFWSKLEIFCLKLLSGSKIQISVEIRNFRLKATFWSKSEILVKNQNSGRKFGRRFKFCSKIEILKVEIKVLGTNRNCLQKIEILVKSRNYGKNGPKFLKKGFLFSKNRNFGKEWRFLFKR